MAKLPKTVKHEAKITTGHEGDSVPLVDNAKENAPNKNKTMSTTTAEHGHKAGKQPGGAR
jgi:hypothetical protein